MLITQDVRRPSQFNTDSRLTIIAYHFPNDDAEQDRLDMLHHIVLMGCDNKLHLAPFKPDGARILDIGTGTGIWAIQMGIIIYGEEI
jgi:hypothetical protein